MKKSFMTTIRERSGKIWLWTRVNLKLVLIISLIGGIPGIINILKWANDKPKFNFFAEKFFQGDINAKKISLYLLSGAIINDGEEPFFPVNFRIHVIFKSGKSFTEYAQPLVDTFFSNPQLTRQIGTILKMDKPNELLKLPRLNAHDATWGSLIFVFPMQPDMENYQVEDVSSAVLTCIDVLKKERKIRLDLADLEPAINEMYSPKTGVYFKDSTR